MMVRIGTSFEFEKRKRRKRIEKKEDKERKSDLRIIKVEEPVEGEIYDERNIEERVFSTEAFSNKF